MIDVEDYLRSKGCAIKKASQYEINVPCFFCGEDENKRGRLYVNTDPNKDPYAQFDCKLCGRRGAMNALLKWFGDPTIKPGDSEPSESSAKRNVHRMAAEYYFANLADEEDVYSYLRQVRGLELETIETNLIGYADGGLRAYLEGRGISPSDMIATGLVKQNGQDFLKESITIPYFLNGNIVQIRGKEIGAKYKTPPGNKAFPYNVDSLRGAEEVIICEGEFDALVLSQMGYTAIGVPGANTWQDPWTEYLKDIPRVHICFDPDEAGMSGAEKLSTKLGGRAKIVELPQDAEGNDVTEWIVEYGHTKEDFDLVLRKSKGGLLISVREAYERWLEVEGNPDLAGLKFGMTKLDEAIKPGLLPGQVMVTMAKTGAGKTVSMLNFFHRMKREQPDRKFLFVSLEQTSNEWFERARRIHRFYEPSSQVTDTIGFWEQNFMMIDKNRVTEEELVNCINEYVLEMGEKPDLVAIDYLGYFANSFRGDKYAQVSAAIMACKAIGKEFQLPVYTPVQVSRLTDAGSEPELGAARDSGVIEETADFVFALWADDQKKGVDATERTGEVKLKILKSRHGGVGTKIDMLFTPKTLAMIPDNDPLHYKAAEEIRLVRIGDDLDTVVYRNLTGWAGTIMTAEVQAEIAKLKADGLM